MDILVENDNFTLNKDINGPALAVAVGIEFILSLVTNLFVLIFTLCHPKTLKQPSIILLTNFVLANLLLTFLVMPFTIVTASIGEWVFGKTLEEKNRTCQFQGFVFAYGIQLILLTLTVMSVDRFLFIVKPFIYKRFMKTWVAVLIIAIVWVMAALINIPPYFGFGQYAFGQFTATCVQVWVGHRYFVAYLCLIIIIVVVIIIVTTLWTFCFTRSFIKRTYHNLNIDEDENDSTQKHLYTKRMRKLVGIFGLLLIVTIVSFVPVIIAGVAGVAVGSDNLPAPVLTVVIVSFLINTVANPIIQSYFRRDMNEFIVGTCQRLAKCIHSGVKQAPTPVTSEYSTGQLVSNYIQLSNLKA